ncbi:MAG: HNH endonuclease [Thermoplasmatales archaeon]|nr:MAG: HNH endonuclease [Thermoplasmatales archaeon]
MKVDVYSHFDHIRPLAMKGKNILSNIQALCATCHQAKTREDRVRIKKWKKKQGPLADFGIKPIRPPKFKF